MSLYIVGIHRLIVKGEEPRRFTLRFGRYELAYWGVAVLFVLAFAVERLALGSLIALTSAGSELVIATDVPGEPDIEASPFSHLSPMAIAASAVSVAVIAWLHIRLALIFPHAAVTGRISPALSWHAMAGNFWRMVGAGLLLLLGLIPIYAALIGLPLLLIKWQVATATEGDPSMQGIAHLALLPGALAGFCLVVTVFAAFMSYVYKDLVDDADLAA